VGLMGNLVLMMGFLSLLWIPALVVVAVFVAIKRRRTMQQALLCTMAVSAERLIPLTPAIAAFAEDAGGRFGVGAAKLANLLAQGCALPDALRRVKRIVPPQLVPIVRVGYESGALAEGLAEAAAAEGEQNALWGSFSAKMLYLAAMPCIGSWLMFYMVVVVLGSYQRIFKDFGQSLPPMTRALFGLSGWATACWPLLLLAAMFFWMLLCYGVLRYLGVPVADLPGTERIMRRQHTAAILDRLALAVAHDRPLAGVIHTLCDCYPKKSIRRRLENVRFDMAHGVPWCESLYRRGLIRQADFAVLQSAQRAGNLRWALSEMADSNRRRLAHRLNVVVQLLFPPAVLFFGAMVMAIVVAMFLPLVSLITAMS
jgi:type II secretory pathway component PulF